MDRLAVWCHGWWPLKLTPKPLRLRFARITIRRVLGEVITTNEKIDAQKRQITGFTGLARDYGPGE